MLTAHEADASIIVFPEDGLYGISGDRTREEIYPYLERIPEVKNGDPIIIPCVDMVNNAAADSSTGNVDYADSLALRELSCMAREYDIVVVANMG